MALTLGDNFSYQGAKPLDGRLKYDTLAAMKAVADATMYDGCMAYCTATEKTYQWKSTNSVDATLGRWREFETGGGGSSTDENAYHKDDTATTTINDSDYFPLLNSSTPKRTLWSNIKAKLKTYFDTIYDLNKSDIPFYATSSTGASTAAKTATVSRGTFSKVVGAKVTIKFTYTNTDTTATLNVNSTGASYIKVIDSKGTVLNPTNWWSAGDVVTFVYDGSYWIMQPTVSMSSLPVLGTIDRSMIFDTTEKVVGKWIDGRPLYQRSFTGTTSNSNDDTLVSTITNARFVDGKGVISYDSSSNATNCALGLSYRDSNGVESTLYAEANSLHIHTPSSQRNKYYMVTAQYYKTSDAANSYNYANENDYSTSEKIIGTWIDGKKLYQKCITITGLTNSSSWASKTVAHNISSVKHFVSTIGCWIYNDTSNSTCGSIPFSDNDFSICSYANNTNVVVEYKGDWSSNNYLIYIILRYTKTTG